MYIFGKQLVGDRNGGNIYEMSDDIYDDNGSPMASERTFTHLSDENKRIRFNSLVVSFETGVGLQTGQGTNPQVFLSVSKDGAKTWSNPYPATIGAAGEYGTRVIFRRLGIAENMTFRLRITDPVKRAIIGGYLN
jgi:hypothetical protein